MREVLNKLGILQILFRRELCHVKFPVCVNHVSLRTSTTERGSWVNQLVEPALLWQFIAFLCQLNLMARIAQGAKTFNRGNKVFCTRVDVVIAFFLFVTYAAHTSEVLDTNKIVVISEHTLRSAFLLGSQSFSAVKQQPSPAIGEGILDKAEYIIITTRMLQ